MRRLAFVVMVASVVLTPSAAAQATALGTVPRVYGAVAAGPGLGAVVGTARPVGGFATAEAALYADYTPRVAGGAGRLLTSVGVGGSLRLARLAAEAQNRPPGRTDLDVGLRLGPAFYTAFFDETAAGEARAFRVMTDAFARATTRIASRRVVFAEVGTQAPAFRVGLSTSVGPSATRR